MSGTQFVHLGIPTICCLTTLSEVQRYVFDSLLKHQLTRDNSFALIKSCGNEVYKVEKSKEYTWEKLKLVRSRNFWMTSKEFLIDQK